MKGILFIILAIVGLCSYLLARRVFSTFREKENKFALFYSIAVFAASFVLLLAGVFTIMMLVVPWGR